jgi:general secretion pathway protein J
MLPRIDRGFTLVEMLVALTLLALTGTIAWRGLEHVAEQRARADDETRATERVLRTLAQMERDFAQAIPDALFAGRSGQEAVLPLALQIAADEEGAIRLTLLRRVAGPHGVRRVTYAVEEASLVRHLSAEDPARVADTVVLLDSVSSLGVRFLLEGVWVEPKNLPPAGRRATAIELNVERADGRRYVQVLPL